MNITVATAAGDKFATFTLSPDETVATVKNLVQTELKIASSTQTLYFKGALLADSKKLSECGVRANDILELRFPGALAPQRQPRGPSLEDIPPQLYNNSAALQQFIRSQPPLMQQLIAMNPTMAEAVLSDNPQFLSDLLAEQADRARQRELEQQRRIMELNSNPMDLEAQAKIEEEIRQKNVQENYEMAVEYNPEAFARVTMLYIPMSVNDTPLTAFIDSGAQSTIMSEACARRCGIMRLIDPRFAGIAKGVGTAKILGRVHAAKVKIGKAFIIYMDFLFGLDQLKRHQASIDLKDNVLRIAGEAIPFLADKDTPGHGKDDEEMEHKGEGKAPAKSTSAARPPMRPAAASASAGAGSGAASGSRAAASAPSAAAPAASKPATPAPAVNPWASPPAATPAAASTPSPAPAPATRSPATAPAPAPASAPATARPTSATPAAARPAATSHSVPATAAPRPATAAAPRTAVPTFAESEIAKLTGLGYSRQQAIQAMVVCGGNTELAASYLFQTSGLGF